jgi:hypothetical protein
MHLANVEETGYDGKVGATDTVCITVITLCTQAGNGSLP